LIWQCKGLYKYRPKSIKLVAVAALLRTEELVLVDDVLGKKSIFEVIDSSGGGTISGYNRIMFCEGMLGGNVRMAFIIDVFRRF